MPLFLQLDFKNIINLYSTNCFNSTKQSSQKTFLYLCSNRTNCHKVLSAKYLNFRVVKCDHKNKIRTQYKIVWCSNALIFEKA